MGLIKWTIVLLLLFRNFYVSASIPCCPEGQALLMRRDVCWEPNENVTSPISLKCTDTLRFLKNFHINDAQELVLTLGDNYIESFDSDT